MVMQPRNGCNPSDPPDEPRPYTTGEIPLRGVTCCELLLTFLRHVLFSSLLCSLFEKANSCLTVMAASAPSAMPSAFYRPNPLHAVTISNIPQKEVWIAHSSLFRELSAKLTE